MRLALLSIFLVLPLLAQDPFKVVQSDAISCAPGSPILQYNEVNNNLWGCVRGSGKTQIGASSSSAFNAITSGTNSTASMVITSGASLAISGTGTIGGLNGTTFGFLDPTSSVQTQLNAKAPLASPTFTGTPAAPTATVGTNTTQVATTAFVLANKGSPGTPVNSVQFNNPLGTFAGSANNLWLDAAMSTPAAPTVTPTCAGTCATTWTYAVFREGSSIGLFSADASTMANAATLDMTHFNTITPPACSVDQNGWGIIRGAVGGQRQYLGHIACAMSFVDTDSSFAAGMVDWSKDYTSGYEIIGSIHGTGNLIACPDYLYQQRLAPYGNAVICGAEPGNLSDNINEHIVDGSGVMAGGIEGVLNYFEVYNSANTGRFKNVLFAEETFNAFEANDFESWVIYDQVSGNTVIGCTDTTHFINLSAVGCTMLDVTITNQVAPMGQHCTLQVDDTGKITKTATCA